MLERDKARRQHSNSAHEVVQLKARLDYLQVALLLVEEEVTEVRSSATTSWVRASGGFSAVANSCCRLSPFFFLFSYFNGILSVTILEGQLAASRHEVGEARLQESLPNEDHRCVMVPRTHRGPALVDDFIAAAKIAVATVNAEDSFCSYG